MTTLTAPHGIVDAPPRDAVMTRPAATQRPVTIADRTCADKGMNVEWFLKTSWFEVKVACSKYGHDR